MIFQTPSSWSPVSSPHSSSLSQPENVTSSARFGSKYFLWQEFYCSGCECFAAQDLHKRKQTRSNMIIFNHFFSTNEIFQDPDRELHVRLSHFRATPFFLLHTSYRAVCLGLVAAFLPVWAWIIILSSLLVINFVLTSQIFNMSRLHSMMTALTAILTPSLYPTDEATNISVIAKFHILNSASVSAVIVIAAAATTGVSEDSLTTLSPVLRSYGVWPPVIVASVVYLILIILIMGFIRPGFLELPPSQYSATRNSVKKIQPKTENINGNSNSTTLRKIDEDFIENQSLKFDLKSNFKMLNNCRETQI